MKQIVNLKPKQILTRQQITDILHKAKSTYDYARFNTSKNNLYLTITFNRDNTIEISTNSRDIGIWQQLQHVKNSYTLTKVIDFCFRWINILNK